MGLDIDHLKQWIGRLESRRERFAPFPAAAMAATLDHDPQGMVEGAALPLMWHWLYFLPLHKMSDVDADGHPKRGGFLPSVPLPRRMFAGSRLTATRPLLIGEEVVRESRILNVEHKSGRSGDLVFVRISHDYIDGKGAALHEEQDVVYRQAAVPGDPVPADKPAPKDALWERMVRPNPVLLFRYSALTFNGHRIHYDHPYTTKTEGYGNLVVHGPLIASLLLDLVHRHQPGAPIAEFSFRAVKPLLANDAFFVCAAAESDDKTFKLWSKDAGGAVTMEATAHLA